MLYWLIAQYPDMDLYCGDSDKTILKPGGIKMSNEQIQNILRDPFPQSIYPQLSQLERNIAKMTVINGMTAQEIADALGCAKSTVNSYRRAVYKALNARPHEWARLVFDRIRETLSDG